PCSQNGSQSQDSSRSSPDFDFRFGYTGRELDKVTGLMYYRARYYDPAVGRFLSEDPIGFDAGDANLYRDVFNSPTNYTDPSGNAAFPVIPIIVAGIVTPFVADTLWSPVQTPETCNDINPGLPWYLRIPAEAALGAGIGAAPGIARGVGGSIARQLPSILDDIARGAGSIGDDIGRALAGSGDELVPALPGGGRLPTGVADDLNPAAPLRSQGNAGGASNPLEPFAQLPKGNIRPDSLDLPALEGAANQPLGRGGLTRAGRALDKHASGPRRVDSPFPRLTGNNANKNEIAAQQINEILSRPDATFQKLGRGGIEV
ncbi:MAG: RHS repeat-associated core domain-containing protein, partial [Cyanobacteria bacterium J06626_4]